MSIANQGFQVTFDEVAQYNWQAILPTLEERDQKHQSASSLLGQKAGELFTAGDLLGERVFRFLGSVMSLFPNFESKEQPFRPVLIEPTRRSTALEDISSQNAEVLGRLASEANDPEVRARFADVAILASKFDPQLVQLAVQAYLKSAKIREDHKLSRLYLQDIKRAIQLAFRLGRKQAPFKDAMEYVEAALSRTSPGRDGRHPEFLIKLMLDYGYGIPSEHGKLAEQFATSEHPKNRPHMARAYWELAAACYGQAKMDLDSNRCALAAAETFATEAELDPGIMAASSHLSSALEALRRANAPKTRIEEVHRKLLEKQKHVHKEMGQFGSDFDVSELREKAANFVKEFPLFEALSRMAAGIDLLNEREERESIQKIAKELPFTALISASMVDRQGRVVATKPSMLTSDPAQLEAATWAQMVNQNSTIDRPFRVETFIDPCRLQIWREHHPSLQDMLEITRNSPFAPPGYQHTYARGFFLGFEGDWHGAAYFLCPQVENSIRHVLDRKGFITSKFDDKHIQEVRSLDTLLLMPETADVLGIDYVFELRCLLIEQFGPNLRNRLAHGLMTDGDCFGSAMVYLWWILMRLCICPLVPLRSKSHP